MADGRIVIDTILNKDPALKGFNELQSSMQSAAKKTKDVGQKMSTYLTAPIVGLGTAAVMTVTSFDDAMARVQAISGATGGELQKLRDLAKELGATTRFSATEA